MNDAKLRVEKELEELGEKVCKLFTFICSNKFTELSRDAQYLLNDQLRVMMEYANILRRRLAIWNKTDEELNSNSCKIM